MAKSKKQITSYEQLRKRIGAQRFLTPAERKVVKRIFNQEMEQQYGDVSFALYLVYLAGKLKGSGVITHCDIESIVEEML